MTAFNATALLLPFYPHSAMPMVQLKLTRRMSSFLLIRSSVRHHKGFQTAIFCLDMTTTSQPIQDLLSWVENDYYHLRPLHSSSKSWTFHNVVIQ
jgi:hypothetical protein